MALRELDIQRGKMIAPPLFVIKEGRVRSPKEESSRSLLDRDKGMSDAWGIHSPYFEFTKGERHLMFSDEKIGDGLRKRIGPISAFTPEEIACFLETARKAYKKMGTMGDFPTDTRNPEFWNAERELIKAFIEGFSRESAIVLVDKLRPDGTRVAVGGLILTAGCIAKPIKELAGAQEASLSTLWVLSFDIPQDLGVVPEANTFCVTRLFSISDDENYSSSVPENERGKLLPELVVGAEAARSGLEKHIGRELKLGIADISEPRLLNYVKHFGWNLLTDSVKPTNQVLSTVLRYHYEYYSRGDNKIYAIMAKKDDLVVITEKQLSKLRRVKSQ